MELFKELGSAMGYFRDSKLAFSQKQNKISVLSCTQNKLFLNYALAIAL